MKSSSIYTCDQCRDSGYTNSVPPLEACPCCEQGRRISAMLSDGAYIGTRVVFEERAQASCVATAAPEELKDANSDWWTPARAEAVLKIALYGGVALSALAFYLLGGNADSLEADAQEPPDASVDNDFSSWEPQI